MFPCCRNTALPVPRRRLIGVAVISALTASAIGLPIVQEFFRVQEWLPLQSVFARMLGYTLTAGIVDAGLKFVVLRYLIYPQGLRVRGDAIAYAFAGAVGYSGFLNLALIWQLEPTWDTAAIYLLRKLYDSVGIKHVHRIGYRRIVLFRCIPAGAADKRPGSGDCQPV